MKISYRRDIDGLHGMSILLVIVFHAFPTLIPGGFIGVDIFFIISGFLISKIMFIGLLDNNFSFLSFCFYRIRRIVPALILVTCPGIFRPKAFRDNGSFNLRSRYEESTVFRRTDYSDIARGRS